MSRLVSFLVLCGILVLSGVLFYHVIASFILPVFLAILLVVIFNPLHQRILKKVKQRHYPAALLTTIAVLGIVLIPFVAVTTFALIEASSALTRVNVGTLRQRLESSRASLGLDIPHAELWRKVESQLTQALLPREPGDGMPQPVPETIIADFDALVAAVERDHADLPDEQTVAVRERLADISQHPPGTIEYDAAVQSARESLRSFKQQMLGGLFWASVKEVANPSDEQFRRVMVQGLSGVRDYLVSTLGNTTKFLAKTIVGLIVMVVAMFFFFADGPAMMDNLMELAPLDRDYERELLIEFDRVTRAVVVATLLSAVVQGLLAGIGYAVAGLDSVFLLMLLTGVFAMVPFFGAAAVWLPACLWLYFYEDRPVAAIMLAIYGTTVVSLADNVIKPWVLHGQSKLHPLAALLSVLGGVQALGPIGILVGPMVFVFLATLLKILRRELTRMEKLPWSNVKKA